jgi:hypothetical protein
MVPLALMERELAAESAIPVSVHGRVAGTDAVAVAALTATGIQADRPSTKVRRSPTEAPRDVRRASKRAVPEPSRTCRIVPALVI